MVVMMLAGVALLRSVGTGQGVAGNLSFKNNATSGSELGVNQAKAYLSPAPTASAPIPPPPPTADDLKDDHPAEGYFASWGVTPPSGQMPSFDPVSFAWDTDPGVKHATANDGTGNRVDYLIHRLCPCKVIPGAPCPTVPVTMNACVRVMDGLTIGSGGGGVSATQGLPPQAPAPYYRITTRTVGPRDTVSYTQVLMK
jgi:hypothetical protein